MEWQAASSSSGPTFFVKRITSTQSVSSSTNTKVQFNDEVWDTDNCFDSTTNYRFTPNKAGYYQLNSAVLMSGGGTGFDFGIKKNGSSFAGGNLIRRDENNYVGGVVTSVVYANGTTDYFEVFVTPYGATASIEIGTFTNFSGIWIRS